MGFFDKITGSKKFSPAKWMFDSNVKAATEFLDYPQKSEEAIFEVLLFASIHSLSLIENIREQVYPDFEHEYLLELFVYAKIHGVTNRIAGDIQDFVYKRLGLYKGELSGLRNNPGTFMPLKIPYNFYERPLNPSSGECLNLELVYKTAFKLKYLIDGIDDSILYLVNTLKF